MGVGPLACTAGSGYVECFEAGGFHGMGRNMTVSYAIYLRPLGYGFGGFPLSLGCDQTGMRW